MNFFINNIALIMAFVVIIVLIGIVISIFKKTRGSVHLEIGCFDCGLPENNKDCEFEMNHGKISNV